MSNPVTVLIVDDHRLFREGLAGLLSADERITVLGQGGDGSQAVELARALSPDVVLLDIEMPGPDVETTLGRLAETAPESRVVILTMHTQPGLVGRLIEQGASGYLTKDLEIEELIGAVVSVGHDRKDFVTLRIPGTSSGMSPIAPSGPGFPPGRPRSFPWWPRPSRWPRPSPMPRSETSSS